VQPYLTVVVAARNDNYGGDFLTRMQLFVSTLAGLCDRHHLDAELVVVEWNPPPDRPPLRDAIEWPRNGLKVRIVTVPGDYHHRLPNSEKMPLFEWIGKNVGVRRASGEFVLVTNPDIIFSRELIAHLAQRNLPFDCYEKVDRYDVGKRVPQDLPVDKMLRFCRRNVVQICLAKEVIDPRFRARARAFFSRLRSVTTRMVAFALHPDRPKLVRWVRRTAKGWRATEDAGRGLVIYEAPQSSPPVLHLAAPGDFLLMGRQQWHELRGFPELTTHSQVDLYMVLLAWAAGLKQLVLPYRIYHQEHDRSEHGLRPMTVLERIPEFREMRETRRVVITNGDNWGLGDVTLPECGVGQLGRDGG
jgi:hypothetical protein